MRKWMKIISVVIVLMMVSLSAFQAVALHNLKKDQEEQFYEHIKAAAHNFEVYQKRQTVIWYDDAMRELHSACSIAGLLDGSEEYRKTRSVLYDLFEKFCYCPSIPDLYSDDLELFIDSIVVAMNDFTEDRNLESFYTKLFDLNFEITRKRAIKASVAGICY